LKFMKGVGENITVQLRVRREIIVGKKF